MNDYQKFKNLLAWFVNQLNINNEVIVGKRLTGKGYSKNSQLHKFYYDYRSYKGFSLDCSMGYTRSGNYATTLNYINLVGTDYSIIPKFDKNSKEAVSLYVGNHPPGKPIEEKSSSISVMSLGLNDIEPNQALRDFFDMFKQQIMEYKNNLTTAVVDEKEQRAAFIQWYSSNVGTAGSAATISTAIAKVRLKNGRAIFSIADYDELNKIINDEGLGGYFESRDGDYSKMDVIFDIESNAQRDDLKNGIKFYLRFLKSKFDPNLPSVQSYWLGDEAYGGGINDVSQPFIENGIYAIGFEKKDISDIVSNSSKLKNWINNIPDNHAKKAFELFSQMKPGDKIAIKAAYPKGKISMLRIKAIGTIMEDLENGYSFDEILGHTIPVEWESITPFVDYELSGYMWTIHQVTKQEDIDMIFYAAKKSMEEDFLNWFGTQKKPDGKPYADNYKNQLRNSLRYDCKKLKDLDLQEHNLFFQTDADAFSELKKRIINSSFYESVDAQAGNAAFSRSLSFYEEFLSEYAGTSATTISPEEVNADVKEYDKEKFLTEVYFDSGKYDDIVALLSRKKNIILQGSPGVGKSYMAKRLAYSIIGAKDENKIEMIQFHQNYSYEDFIEGFRPSGNGDFELKKGVFYNFCVKAQKDKANKYFFIIDEINRGNLSKVMGELMLLLEYDKRGNEFAMKLTYSSKPFYVPDNIYVIGMMNTADRSLAMIDYALRRRFCFMPVEPVFDNQQFITDFKSNYPEAEAIVAKIKKLNSFISENLDEGHQIGHSYFCSKIPFTTNDIEGIIKYEIEELLNEYFFDDKDNLEKAKGLLK